MATRTLEPLPTPNELRRKPKGECIERPPSAQATTPLMRQYLSIKERHPEEVLFFRLGDFYEMFFEDAEVVSRVLGIALTSRRNDDSTSYAMAGFPIHAVDRYLPRMIAAGYRVAICEQVEDAAAVKGKRIVRREVIEVVTPGTLTDEKLLDERAANFLLSLHLPRPRLRSKECGLAWFEASSGRFQVTRLPLSRLEDELERIGPAEVLLAEGLLRDAEREEEHPRAAEFVARLRRRAPLSPVPDWVWRPAGAVEALRERFGVASLGGLGLDERAPYVSAAQAALHYVGEVKPGFLDHLDRHGRGIELHRPEEHSSLDPATARCLEIVRPLREETSGGATLLRAIDRTRTAMGTRLLREWLLAPLRGPARIARRQDAVEALLGAPAEHEALLGGLGSVYDLERLAARSATGRVSPRDMAALRESLGRLPAIQEAARAAAAAFAQEDPPGSLLAEVADRLDPLTPLHTRLAQALEERPAQAPKDGQVIAAGWSEELDALRAAAGDVTQTLARFQEREAERTGIPSLKVGYNKVLGYYLEVTQAHRKKVPDDYVRKQTLKHCERFLTPELKELEADVLTATERAEQLETALLNELRQELTEAASGLLRSAAACAQLDVLAAFATLARQRGYVRPRLTEGPRLQVVGGRHPVLDLGDLPGGFVPNDLTISAAPEAPADSGAAEGGTLHLITGPNMAGKSTYIRQAALLVLLAQTGCFLPAEEAEVGVVDRVFARVGAGDELAQGLSTFMVGMTQTADILRHATSRSLVILDEVGRGTSTYDGVSLAWAIAEYLHDAVGARTLFATHYHELTRLAALKPGVRNRNVAVEEKGEAVHFLHTIVPGSADRSYGIHVARLAGLPGRVLTRAQAILRRLEEGSFDPLDAAPPRGEAQLPLFETPGEDPLRRRLEELDLDNTTPLEALQLLAELQGQAGGG